MISRKDEHIRICLDKRVEAGEPGFNRVRLKNLSLPETSLGDLDTSLEFLGKELSFPLIIEAMTGGTHKASRINRELAQIAQEYGIGMGVGSQRSAIEDKSLEKTFRVRDVAKDIFLIANLGAVQFNHGYGKKECEAAVDMIGADALALHLNPVQEAIQPEGDTDFRNLTKKINSISKSLDFPVIAKQVGEGLDLHTAGALHVDAYDVGGWGGTNWNLVESYRCAGEQEAGAVFSEIGIPTVESIISVSKAGKPVIGSGGVRSGVDAAKCIALGADIAGVALPLLKAQSRGGLNGLRRYLDIFIRQFKISMYCVGASNISELRGKAIYE